MRIVVNIHWRVYLDFGRAGSLSLQLYRTYHRLLHLHVAVNSHTLPVYKKNRIASLLCIFETIISTHLKHKHEDYRSKHDQSKFDGSPVPQIIFSNH